MMFSRNAASAETDGTSVSPASLAASLTWLVPDRPANAATSRPSATAPNARPRRTPTRRFLMKLMVSFRGGVRPPGHRPALARLNSVPGRACQRLDEIIELARGPALVGVAEALVAGDHRVAVVPVQARLRVKPERAAGAI